MKSITYAVVTVAVALFVWNVPVAQAHCGACPAGAAKAAAPSAQPVKTVAAVDGSGAACAKTAKAEGGVCDKAVKAVAAKEDGACDKAVKTVAAKEGGCSSKTAKTVAAKDGGECAKTVKEVAANDAAGGCEKQAEKAKLAAAE